MRFRLFLFNTSMPSMFPNSLITTRTLLSLIICQAMIERIPITTVNRQLEPYDVKALWGN